MMLTLICGLPNAGKTTYSERYANVIHSDDYPKSRDLLALVSDILEDVCVEGIFVTAHSRRRLLESYLGDSAKCIFLDTPMDVCIERENRGRSTMLIRNCASVFEYPSYDEGWDDILIVRGNDSIHLERET